MPSGASSRCRTNDSYDVPRDGLDDRARDREGGVVVREPGAGFEEPPCTVQQFERIGRALDEQLVAVEPGLMTQQVLDGDRIGVETGDGGKLGKMLRHRIVEREPALLDQQRDRRAVNVFVIDATWNSVRASSAGADIRCS